MKYLDRITNIAVLVAVVAFLFIMGRNELARRNAPATMTAKDFVGKTVKLPGVQFSQEHNSLILAVSTTCHFCKDSLTFYQELTTKANGQLDVIGVFPQPETEAKKFFEDAHVRATQVVSASLDTVGVSATPTLLLVDTKGKVIDAWLGALDEKGRQQLVARVLPGSSVAHDLSPKESGRTNNPL